MNSINIKNGILVKNYDNYHIYEMYNEDTEKYYMCIPNNDNTNYQMVIDFPEEYYNSLLNEEIIDEIKKIYDKLYEDKNNYVYILSNVNTSELNEIIDNNDDYSYSVLLRRIQKYTYNAYKSLIDNQNIKIDQVIKLIIQTDKDKKFINWLDTYMTDYFKGIDLSYLTKKNININNNIVNDNKELDKSNIKIKKLVPNKKGFSSSMYIFLLTLISILLALCCSFLFIK